MNALKQAVQGKNLSFAVGRNPRQQSLVTTLSRRLTEMKAFCKDLERVADENAEIGDLEFALLIDLAINHYNVPPGSIAEKLNVAPSAISRWSHRKSFPRPYARGSVLSVVGALLLERIAEFRSKIEDARRG